MYLLQLLSIDCILFHVYETQMGGQRGGKPHMGGMPPGLPLTPPLIMSEMFFSGFLFISTHISLDLIFLGNAEAYIG